MTDAADNSQAPDGVRDFTIKMEPHRFRIDADIFSAPPILSPVTLGKLAALHANMGEMGGVEGIEVTLAAVSSMFRLILPGPSGERFAERLMSVDEPIDLQRQALPALYYLLECYGLRPTQPSSPSLDGSTGESTDTQSDGISSTDGASSMDAQII